MDDKYLEELFALPIGLELEAIVDGVKYYSSQKLKESFMKSIGASGRASHLYKQIESLVMKKKLLVPCFLSKNMFKYLKHKMFGKVEDTSFAGFYLLTQKRVFIIIDNNTTIVGTAKNDLIASTVMHECVHLYADRMRTNFLKTFFPELERYYISYFSRVFQTSKKPDVTETIKFLSKFEYNKDSQSINKVLVEYYYMLEKVLKPISGLDERTFILTLQGLIVSIKLSLMQFDVFVRMYRQYINILGPLDRAYQEAFGKRNTFTTPYQELSSVSEVICVLSEMNPSHPKIKKMFKDMA